MKTALFATAFAAFSVSGAAFADDVTGAWTITGDVAGNAIENVTCTFDAKNATCGGKDGKTAAPSPVTVAGKDVTWDWDAGQAVLTFKGKLDSDKSMKGDIEVQGITGSFTAAKN